MLRSKLLLPLALLLAAFFSANASAAPLKLLGFDDMSCKAWLQ